MEEQKLTNETKKELLEALKRSKLTPTGVEWRMREIKKMLRWWALCLGGGGLLAWLLYDIKVNDNLYELGMIAAMFLTAIAGLCLLAAIIIPFFVWQAWREIRRARKESNRQ